MIHFKKFVAAAMVSVSCDRYAPISLLSLVAAAAVLLLLLLLLLLRLSRSRYIAVFYNQIGGFSCLAVA